MIQGDVFRISYYGDLLGEPYSNVFDFRLKDVPFIGSGADPDEITDEAVITALANNFRTVFWDELAPYLSNNLRLEGWNAFFMFEPTIGLGQGFAPVWTGDLTADNLLTSTVWYIKSKGKVRTRGGGQKKMGGITETYAIDGIVTSTFVSETQAIVDATLNSGVNVESTGFYLFEFESVITHLVKELNLAGEVKGYRVPVTSLEWSGYVADNWAVDSKLSDYDKRRSR